ncbi:MAG: PQQ-binding-like beta-propeller repeat protein [Anaerolineae bacterium]
MADTAAAGFVSAATFQSVPSLPPVSLDGGGYAIASADVVEGVTANGTRLWRVQGDSVITGLAALSGDRVVAHTRNGLVMVLQGGNYQALWNVAGPDEPFIVPAGTETLIFVTNLGLAAYDTSGTSLWTAQAPIAGRISTFSASSTQVMLGLRGDSRSLWSIFDAATGTLLNSFDVSTSLTAAPAPDGSWYVLDGAQFSRYADGQLTALANIGQLAGRTARIVADTRGVYLYTADASNTLLALSPQGKCCGALTYPYEGATTLAPLMASDRDCLLYTGRERRAQRFQRQRRHAAAPDAALRRRHAHRQSPGARTACG